MRTSDRLKSPEYNLEIGTDTPNVRLILKELEEAQTYASRYCDRNANALRCWHSVWDGQTCDGRKHAGEEGEDAFPFEGASDSRIRTVKEQIRDHATLAQFAYDNAKVQAETVRPFADGMARQANKATKLLKWQLGTQLRAQLDLEIPLALNWRFGYGAALLGVDWWQCRRLEKHNLTIPMLADIVSAQTGQDSLEALMQVQSALLDPALEDRMVSFIQSLSPIVTTRQARKILTDLQQLRTAEIQVPYTFRSQPRLTALRPGVDVLFRDLTGDLQEEPWVAWRERVSETDLYDRIETEEYDPGFVEEAIERKGEGSDDIWLRQTLAERGVYGGYAQRYGWVNSYANTIELYHFYYKARMNGTPCVFRTVFNPAVVGKDLKNPVYAWHGLHPYKHGLYPMTPMRFEKEERPICSSQGIAEIAYTWEQEEKAQADGLADRTALVNAPPLITPYNKVAEIRGTFGPRAVLGVTRPQEIQWMPLPPTDGTPVLVLAAVAKRVQRFFGIFGEDVDPDLKNMRRQQLAKTVLGEIGLAGGMMFQLDQQYLPDSEVEQTVGPLALPFQVSREEIQEQHTVRVTFDTKMIDEEYVEKKLGLIGQAMSFNQDGTANVSALFRIALEMIDPDAADKVIENDQVATEREKNDEVQAISNAFNGLESPLPMHGNHQLRLQTIMEQTVQSQNPKMRERLAQNPDTVEILKKRIEFLQNQIQQYQQNPQIGRMLGTRPFSKEAPAAALPQGS